MITKHNEIEEIASRIDVGLCGACGAIRMSSFNHEDDDNPLRVSHQPEVTAVLLSQVRRDIVSMTSEMRRGFDDLSDRVRALELINAESKGALAGVKGTMSFIVVLSTLLGGLVGWVVSLVTRKP